MRRFGCEARTSICLVRVYERGRANGCRDILPLLPIHACGQPPSPFPIAPLQLCLRLLDLNAEVNVQDNLGKSPAMYAAENGLTVVCLYACVPGCVGSLPAGIVSFVQCVLDFSAIGLKLPANPQEGFPYPCYHPHHVQ